MSSILVLGGTGFIGPEFARAALDAGHEVTLFHRGNHPRGPGLEEAAEILGDRMSAGDLARAATRDWDAVVDLSCYVPRAARLALDALEQRTGRMVFISTVSVYADDHAPYVPEDGPLATLEDESVEEIRGDTYGGLKVLCEAEVMARMAGRAVVVRPTIVAGPGDPTHRFTYWCRRFARGGRVVAGTPQDLEIQYIDVRDLAAFILLSVDKVAPGVYNAAGPADPLSFAALLEGVRAGAGSTAEIEWLPAEYLLEQGVAPWSDLPFWLPPSVGYVTADVSRAVAAGLRCRPVEDTARDTLEWARDRPGPEGGGPPGLPEAREAELLDGYPARV